ncbi:universal stress protein [Streptomyces sp. NPDC001380]|uniref:universal stress protein n=1 Tax=Streptomyces sp. NPDC001380 TaxID=3364566 RepID=UPI003677D940
MPRPIVVGLDASPESVAAADWAAREALLRGLPVELVQAWPRLPEGHRHAEADREGRRWGERVLARMEVELRTRHAGADVTTAQVPGAPAEVLTAAGRRAALLVLGSRGLGALRGFLIGSVAQTVLSRSACPVVLVRAAADLPPAPAAEHPAGAPPREVVLGLDLRRPCDDVLAFAFEEAALRSALLRAVHAWNPPAGLEHGPAPLEPAAAARLLVADEERAEAVLRPWREKHPQVRVVHQTVRGSAGAPLAAAAVQAGLLVVGRRDRESAVGLHIGPVTHAAVHHAACPVAVVPYR